MKQIEVAIMGQSYLLGCPEGGETRLREAVAQVDREMCAIRDSGKLKARERIAVLAALNLAYGQTDRGSDTASNTSPRSTPSDELDHAGNKLEQLIQRLDQALAKDGQLL
jgi:cell division protein ZapA